jgi:RNA polymerase sigma factor (sigma-70 family)
MRVSGRLKRRTTLSNPGFSVPNSAAKRGQVAANVLQKSHLPRPAERRHSHRCYDERVTDPGLSPDHSAQLLKRWQEEGDVDALDELLRVEVHEIASRLRQRARGMLRPSTSASDLAQEAVFRMLRLEETPEFTDPREMRAYLWTAAWRLLINRGRSRNHHVVPLSQAQSADMGLVLAGGGGISEAERADQNAALSLVMNLLRNDDREILDLVYFQHLDVDQVAEKLGLKRAATEMRLSRARRRLAEKMVAWSEVVE